MKLTMKRLVRELTVKADSLKVGHYCEFNGNLYMRVTRGGANVWLADMRTGEIITYDPSTLVTPVDNAEITYRV